MTTVHYGADNELHAYLQVTRADGSHDEIQLPDTDEETAHN